MTKSDPKIAVLIVAGGNGLRMGQDTPKQYLTIQGKTILCHTVEVFEKMNEISKIHCVIGPDHEHLYQQALGRNPLPYSIGGTTRQESVYNGLKALQKDQPDFVLIHDAARPCVSSDDIRRLIHTVQNEDAATLAQPVTESLQRDGKTIDRDNLWILQTPQGFPFEDIFQAHKNSDKNYTDDTAIYMAYAKKQIHYVRCGRHNLKITNSDDMIMAEKLLSKQVETITGQGFDVHAFEDKETKTIRLCGIDIPHNRSLEGHSDADIGLHVLTDAIFSAIAEGDIGYHFPSSDDNIRNMNSHHFLDKAITMLKEKDGELRHLDITFICEKPNIGKYRDQMREHLSKYLGLPLNRISIKGTTSQKLGFTGREEGIAAQSIVTIRMMNND